MAVNLLTATGVERVRLYTGSPATTGTNLYTVATGTQVRVGQLLVCNVTTGVVALSFRCTLAGASSAQSWVSNHNIQANDTVFLNFKQVIEPGDVLNATQSVADALTLTLSGELYR